jgi:hypothetical protein
MSINPENNYRDQYSEPESIVLNLENLNVQYNNLLLQYKQAVANYANFLQEESLTPCGKYSSDSNNIDQPCYNDIWSKAGCTQPPRSMSSQTASTTLDGWILDSFKWATNTDYDSRMGCYGHADSPYMIIGVALDGNYLVSRPGLNGGWSVVNDNSNGNIKNICTGSDGKTIIGITVNNQIVTKPTWDAATWSAPIISYSCTLGPSCSSTTIDTRTGAGDPTTLFSSGGNNYCCANKCYNKNEADCGNDKFAGVCSTGYYQTYVGAPNNGKTEVNFIAIAQGPDGTLVAIGANDHQLWTAPNLQSCWTNVASQPDEWQNSICIGPNGRIIVGNSGIPYLFYKDSYKNLQNQNWIKGCQGCCQDITVAPDGTFLDAGACNDYQIWSMDSYMNLNGQWKGPYTNSCCIQSLTTIANNISVSSDYSTATQPNYNIDSQPLTSIQGQAFWGTGPIGSQNPYTNITNVNDCQALCSSTANCTGATFNPNSNGQPMCWLRTGDGEPMPSSPNDYAIVSKAVQLLSVIDQINTQLISVNDVILKNITNGQPIYNAEAYSRKNKTQELIQNYENLQKERAKIREQINRYESLDEAELQGNININQNYYSFLLLMLLVAIIIYIIFKFSSFFPAQSNIFSSPQLGGGFFDTNTDTNKYMYYLIFTMIVLTLLVIFYQQMVQTTTTTLSNTATASASIFNMLSGGLTSGPVFNFN